MGVITAIFKLSKLFMKFYYENELANHNETAKTNVAWVCDITEIELEQNKKRFRIVPRRRVILHSDRGTQFSSICYNNFTKKFEQFIIPSMSRENTPTDNGVAERFMRTFKEHKINGKIIEQSIQEAIILNKRPRSILNKYIISLNQKPNNK